MKTSCVIFIILSGMFLTAGIICAIIKTIILFTILGIILSFLCGLLAVDDSGYLEKFRNVLNW